MKPSSQIFFFPESVLLPWTLVLVFIVKWYLSVQYHGGTNFDRTAGGPFITTSYDYDAPIDEYGMLFFLME